MKITLPLAKRIATVTMTLRTVPTLRSDTVAGLLANGSTALNWKLSCHWINACDSDISQQQYIPLHCIQRPVTIPPFFNIPNIFNSTPNIWPRVVDSVSKLFWGPWRTFPTKNNFANSFIILIRKRVIRMYHVSYKHRMGVICYLQILQSTCNYYLRIFLSKCHGINFLVVRLKSKFAMNNLFWTCDCEMAKYNAI